VADPSRRRGASEINAETDGLALVDKPGGMTSHDVVDVVRRRLGTRKVGHAGTLDPMATGLLLLGVGRATRLLRFFGDLSLRVCQRLFITTHTLVDQVLHFFFSYHAFPDQPLRINRAHAGMRFHARVHQRLRVARLVRLVVTESTKTDHVDHDVLVELLTIIERDLQHAIRGLGIVAVDMKDRQLRHARNVG